MTHRRQFNVGIVGCGLIGEKRAAFLGDRGKLTACFDVNGDRATALANKYSALAYGSLLELLKAPDVDIVIVSTLHESLSQISTAATKAGKHVLVEKPAAKSLEDLNELINASKNSSALIRVGFNHRYHRALVKAKEIVDKGELGDLMFLRGRYGHGGRLGYDKEWRSDPALSGGGELIDQGSHIIDLSRWFLGDFTKIHGTAHTYFWDMAVDDNAFLHLETSKGKVAFFHVSCTEWKNTFSLELYGKRGKLAIDGLGGSYGTETLSFFKMLPEMGPPETTCWQYPMPDNSWGVELEAFYDDIELKRQPSVGIHDAQAALAIIQKIYVESGYDYHS